MATILVVDDELGIRALLSDGPLTLTAYLRSSNGTSTPIVAAPVVIDRTAPVLASATVTNASPTNSSTYALSYGAISNGTYSQYCILENDTVVANCAWQSGTLPSTYGVSSTNGSKILSVWIRDAAGNVSSRVPTPPVELDNISPTLSVATPANGSFIHLGNYSAYTAGGTCGAPGSAVTFTGAATGSTACSGGGTWSVVIDLSSSLDGALTLSFGHADAAGNAAAVIKGALTMDTVSPVFSFSVAVS